MRLIRPTPVTEAALQGSSVAETEHPAWAAGTTYALDSRVIYGHRIWASLASGNTGHRPDLSPTFWVDTGPTNRWAMFDRSVGTQTVAGASLTVTLEPGGVDALALLETQAASVTVRMVSGTTTVYDQTISMEAAGYAIDDWFDYFFAPVGRKRNLVIEDLPVYTNGVITVTIEHETDVRCGVLLVGRGYTVGDTLARPKVGITDYSRKETDAFGVTDVVERAFSKRADVQLILPTAFVDDVIDRLAAVRATPCLWIGGRLDALKVYGFYKQFEVEIAYTDKSFCSLTLEGLT